MKSTAKRFFIGSYTFAVYRPKADIRHRDSVSCDSYRKVDAMISSLKNRPIREMV